MHGELLRRSRVPVGGLILELGLSGAGRPVPPIRNSERALIARQHTTVSAMPVATAIAACADAPACETLPPANRSRR